MNGKTGLINIYPSKICFYVFQNVRNHQKQNLIISGAHQYVPVLYVYFIYIPYIHLTNVTLMPHAILWLA